MTGPKVDARTIRNLVLNTSEIFRLGMDVHTGGARALSELKAIHKAGSDIDLSDLIKATERVTKACKDNANQLIGLSKTLKQQEGSANAVEAKKLVDKIFKDATKLVEEIVAFRAAFSKLKAKQAAGGKANSLGPKFKLLGVMVDSSDKVLKYWAREKGNMRIA